MNRNLAIVVTKNKKLAMRLCLEVTANGWIVEAVAHFTEGLNRMASLSGTFGPVGLLIVDAQVNGDAAATMVRQLRSRDADVPVIVVVPPAGVPGLEIAGRTSVLKDSFSGRELKETIDVLTDQARRDTKQSVQEVSCNQRQECHRAVQNQPPWGESKPATRCVYG